MKATFVKLVIAGAFTCLLASCTPEPPNPPTGSTTTTVPVTTSTTIAPHSCEYVVYTGAELTTGVIAQIGQLINGQSYVSSVSYSEYPSGVKYNIRYGLENGASVDEASIVSVQGTPGFYRYDGSPINITNHSDICPPYPGPYPPQAIIADGQVLQGIHFQWNPDISGDIVTFDELISDEWQLMYVNIRTGAVKQITSGITGQIHRPRVHDGYIVFNKNVSGVSQIFLYDTRIDVLTQITSGDDSNYNPDIWGQTIVWSSNSAIDGASRITQYDISSGVSSTVVSGSAGYGNPSVGSNWITWTQGGSDTDIYARSITTGSVVAVSTSVGAQDNSRTNGNLIVWDDKRRGSNESDVYALETQALTEKLVSNGSGISGRPDTNGQSVVFTNFSSTAGDIELFRQVATSPAQLTSGLTTQSQPAIDGGRVVYLDYSSGQPTVHIKTP